MKLYRYQAINKFSLINLSLCKNWVSNPKSFNDPFEFRMRSNYVLSPDFKMVPIPIEHYKTKKTVKKEIDTLGVVCFSELESDILMWSHYADGHKGMLLVFDVENHKAESIYDVKYEKMIPELDFEQDAWNLRKGLAQVILTKAESWSYEKEWRQIVSVQEKHIEYPGKLIEIIFGCKASSEDMEMVWRITEPIYGQDIIFSRLEIQEDCYNFSKRFVQGENKNLKERNFFSNENLNPWKHLEDHS